MSNFIVQTIALNQSINSKDFYFFVLKIKETEEAFLLRNRTFGQFWIPKKLVNNYIKKHDSQYNLDYDAVSIVDFKFLELLNQAKIDPKLLSVKSSSNITLFSDASFRNGYAGFSCWIKHPAELEKNSKFIDKNGLTACKILLSNGKTDNNIDAEIIALRKGILYLLENGYLKNGIHLSLQTDCLTIIDKLENEFKDEFESMGCSYKFKHVYSHTRNNDSRSIVNELCDISAKNIRKLLEFHNKKVNNLIVQSTLPAIHLHHLMSLHKIPVKKKYKC